MENELTKKDIEQHKKDIQKPLGEIALLKNLPLGKLHITEGLMLKRFARTFGDIS